MVVFFRRFPYTVLLLLHILVPGRWLVQLVVDRAQSHTTHLIRTGLTRQSVPDELTSKLASG